MDRFPDRRRAGRALAVPLLAEGLDRPLLVGLARGGVPVAVGAAQELAAGGVEADVDVAVARKVTAPGRPEAGLGAVASDGEPVWFDRALRSAGLTPGDLAARVDAERGEARRREQVFGARWRARARDRDVVLVDDGIATAMTTLAALGVLVRAGAARIVVAAPVAAPSALERLDARWGGPVVVLRVPEGFRAVSEVYDDFRQLDDADVAGALGYGP